ncbi:MAG: rhodanese-like domain-containing protein [Candidatus Dojkabacteria bacterium]|nr:rhodanese-like domain-containing protein [Candidatus Dojkabacteria bacterium]
MPFKALRELPEKMDMLNHLKNKKVITVCTGGVKCEKASGYLKKQGFTDVHQLHGGIHDYIEKFPNQHFKGKLYVYDGRVVMGFELDAPEHQVVSNCDKCGETSDNYVDCTYLHCKGHRHFVCCDNCLEKDGTAFCSDNCKELAYADKKIFVRQ